MKTKTKLRKLSERGDWVVVSMWQGKVWSVRWAKTWAGVESSKRNIQQYIDAYQRIEDIVSEREKRQRRIVGRVFVLDINRMLAFAATEGVNEIYDLERLLEM